MPKHPPRGYNKMQHPLPHNFSYYGIFDILDLAKDATILTLFRGSETTLAPDTIEVNPRHDDFAEDTGPTCIFDSIIPKVNFTFRASLSQAMLGDYEFAKVLIKVMPIYIAFEDSLIAKNMNSPAETEVEDILELAHSATSYRVNPLFASKLTTRGTQPYSTITAVDTDATWGLTTNANLESVAFENFLFYDALQYYTNRGMLNKVIGPIKTFELTREKSALYHSDNFTNPSVKRINPYTFCAVLVWTEIPGVHSQGFSGEYNGTDLDLVYFNADVRFDEWNAEFDQTTT